MKKILITGAPCSGKSELIKRLVEHYSTFKAVIWSKEAITELKSMGFKYELFNDVCSFQQLITGYQVSKERLFDQKLNNIDCAVFYDRGVFDGFAYIDDASEEIINAEYDLKNWRYDIVLIFQSAYTNKDIPTSFLPIRRENVAEISTLEKNIRKIYEDRFDNVFWIAAEIDFEKKLEAAYKILDRFI